MQIKIVTSFNKRIFDEYASKSLQTWVDNIGLPEGSEIEVWINGAFPSGLPKKTFNGTPFKYKMLDTQSSGWTYFYETFINMPKPNAPKGQEYRFNFLPFSCKVYALAEAAQALRISEETNPKFELLVWIDADVTFKKPMGDMDFIKILGDKEFAWLDRGRPWAHGETGFMICRTTHDNLDLFLTTANFYGSGALFYMAEWHDAFVFTSQIRLKEFTDPNFKVMNLNTDMKSEVEQGLFPFKTSVLNEYMDHYKGPRKEGIQGGNKS